MAPVEIAAHHMLGPVDDEGIPVQGRVHGGRGYQRALDLAGVGDAVGDARVLGVQAFAFPFVAAQPAAHRAEQHNTRGPEQDHRDEDVAPQAVHGPGLDRGV